MGPTVGAVSLETNLGILWVETPFHKGIDKRASPDVLKVPRQIRFLTVAGNKRVGRVDAPLREAFGHVPLHTDPGRPAQSGADALVGNAVIEHFCPQRSQHWQDYVASRLKSLTQFFYLPKRVAFAL